MQRVMSLVGVFAALATISAQQPAPTPDRPTFRSSATLATIDAVVVDDEGRQVTDLTREDFQVTVDGKRQMLQQAVYVPVADVPPPRDASPGMAGAGRAAATPLDASRLLEQTGAVPARISRTIAFVVDDLSLSFESTFYVRRAIQKYVDSQVGPGDLVAIVRTASGVGALQQFTTDKRLLRLAVDRIQWDFRSRQGVASFAAVVPIQARGPGTFDQVEVVRNDMAVAGSLGALQYIARGVRALPGRKSIVFVSEGFPEMFGSRLEGGRQWNALTRALDEANRAGVVIHTLDPRGLQTGGLTAEDDPQVRPALGPSGAAPTRTLHEERIRKEAGARMRELLGSQESLRFIADQTGGLAIANTNDLGRGIARVLDEDRGYYLLGYPVVSVTPPSGWNFEGVTIEVRRPHTHVRYRRGFFGPATEREPEQPEIDPVLLAALSPFTSGDVTVRLTSSFWHERGGRSSVRSFLFIDANDLQFTEDPTGWRATIDLMIFAVGDNGRVIGALKRTLPLQLSEKDYRDAKVHGLVYRASLEVSRPGPYQIRAAVLDKASGRIGSGSQFLEVPEVGKGKLAVSGVMLKGVEPEATTANDGTIEVASTSLSADALLGPTIRILPAGSKAVYAYEIYDGLGQTADLQMAAALLRNGKAVYQSPATPVKAEAVGPGRVISIGGALDLGEDVPPGPYTLQVDVWRQRNGKIDRRASQWVDFEVRR